ncbi:IPT/TIG domain-containing protein [Paenibacillus harenae]|uniref:Lysophospholipase L1-like esterase n=1 Tax=Paenibacillus harenae TaxID=306543 RepID=A0ABT9TW27_PAEHA|nr:IPT/TIG domain-containing protein [Paenibacillus harenae]MDQ0111297.1 lysophospholipase L1-like esterase [Paenibacillus harenae]
MSKGTYGSNTSIGGMQTNAFAATLKAGSFTAAPQMVNDRLSYHKALLESKGITSLSGLGMLRISGQIVPQQGVTKPGARIISGGTMVQSTTRIVSSQKGTSSVETYSGKADILTAIPFTSKDKAFLSLPSLTAAGSDIFVDSAYWAASEVYLVNGTNIVLKYPLRNLIIIAEKLTVEENVTISWERPYRTAPPQKNPAPRTPDEAPMSTTLVGIPGTPGEPGWTGDRGYDGARAPELEVWVLEMTGRPRFDLRGQDGTQGGQGQNGGNGGKGGRGKPAVLDWAGFCKAGAGAGGNGGNGGRGGNGGAGGNGGSGGRLSLYAPQPVLQQYAAGFEIRIEGGSAGIGGAAGYPGIGGEGGAVGASKGSCGPGPRRAGQHGSTGAYGMTGPNGQPGGVLPNPIGFFSINADDFRRKMLEPAINRVTSLYVKSGERVTVYGLRFTMSDIVVIDGIEAATTVVSDTELQFTVPQLFGGSRMFQVRQTDSTLSNLASVYVLPQIMDIGQEGMEERKPNELLRVKPGMKVTLKGSGFAEGTLVLVNDHEMPDVRLISSNQIEFTMVRPSDTVKNASGEQVALKVRFADGTLSNTFQLELETYHMLVIGDSVSWGQGMQEHEKFYSLVGAAIQAKNGNIKQYTSVLAHSGATIGIGDQKTVDPVDGEVPTSYPTIWQQCDLFTGSKDKVDLVLMDGGMNDVDVTTVLNPFNPANLDDLFEKHFNQSMYTLLDKVTRDYPKAKVIVTGYYAPISRKSDLAAVEALLIALGILVGGAGGGAAGGLFGLAEFEAICNRCEKLERESKIYLQQAINKRNSELSESRIFFADPNFGPDHAALTDDPYLFGVNLDLSPQDFIASDRLVSCTKAGCTGLDMEKCKRASMGHPNPKGAQAYANAIIQLL